MVLAGQQSLQGLPLALELVNGPRLFAVLIHAQHDAAVEQLLVDLDGRRGQEDHHRSLDAVFLGGEPAGVGVLGGAGDHQLAFALQSFKA